jgi:outer membrane protein assembly factor BamD (BamD/ComL family)
MRKHFLALLLVPFLLAVPAAAQRNIEPKIDTDPVLEVDAKHNLDVAKQYFVLKKAYKAVLMRFEETYAAYPAFSKMDEFLYYAGMSSYYLSLNKGKQKVDTKENGDLARYSPKRLREDAEAYLSQIVEKYPESQFRENAQKALKDLKPGQ